MNLAPWDIMETSPWVVPMLELVGVREIRGPEHNPIIVAMLDLTPVGEWSNDDEKAWCGASQTYGVLAAIARGAHWVPEPPDDPHRARNWLKWGVRVRRTRGAVCVVQALSGRSRRRTGSASGGNHVGTVLDWRKGAIQLVSGNKSDAQNIAWFDLKSWRVRGYRMAA